MAVRELSLLRKVFKRIWTKWHGKDYLSSMLQDLEGRQDPVATEVHRDLLELVRHPDFYEDWD